MNILALYLAASTFVATVALASQVVFGLFRIRSLSDFPPGYGDLPRVSMIVAARNEERHIEAALRSLLRIDYEPLEIIVVNDRSTDRTGEILDRLSRENSHIHVANITSLPPGYLGKNHALQYGASRAQGDWLLFTDADILYEPLAVRRAIGYALQNHVDHLTLAPDTRMPTWLLRSFIVAFSLMFHIFLRTWNVNSQKSKSHVGIGAFNLVRREVYESIGGHSSIAMRPDDDVKLGKVIKDSGYRQHILSGVGEIQVEWYNSLRELIVGLEKNSFAVMEYRPVAVLASVFALLLLTVWPFVGMVCTFGIARWLNVATSAIWLGLAVLSADSLRAPRSTALVFPFAIVTFAYIQLRSMWITLKTGGIRWRDTFYPLAELKANRV